MSLSQPDLECPHCGGALDVALGGWNCTTCGGQWPSHRRPLNFGELRRVTPISRRFGYERGRPVDRYYIERFLNAKASDITGVVLEVGDNTYTLRYGAERVTRSEVLHVTPDASSATIVGDLADLPQVETATFDCVICTQTLQYIYNLPQALQTLHRILKPNGTLLATVPGISQIDDPTWSDRWYWNFTVTSVRRLLNETFTDGVPEIHAAGNVLAATAFLHGMATEDLTPEELDFVDPAYPLLIATRTRRGREDHCD